MYGGVRRLFFGGPPLGSPQPTGGVLCEVTWYGAGFGPGAGVGGMGQSNEADSEVRPWARRPQPWLRPCRHYTQTHSGAAAPHVQPWALRHGPANAQFRANTATTSQKNKKKWVLLGCVSACVAVGLNLASEKRKVD
jgi:hypothetical protein